jgi:iron complex outermembrane receptor protein
VYDIERENIAIPDETAFLLQAGDQESRGVELELAAEPLRRLRTFLSYAYNDSELTRFSDVDAFSGGVVERSGNAPPYAPEHLVALWVSRDFRSGLGLAGGGRYFSEQFINADNAFEVDDAVVLDAAVFYDLEAWRFKLNFKNLTDEEYETGSYASTSVLPADAFSVQGSFEYRF